jgi:hypothetical protein
MKIRLQSPHPAQIEILQGARRFNVVCLGRRSGKTTLGLNVLTEAAVAGHPVGYFAPTYKLLAEFWREIRRTLDEVTATKSEQDHRLELVTGGTVECWSLDDPNPARGRRYAVIVVDEAAMVRDLLEIWQLALRPTLVDYGGRAWFLSTPRGLNGFYDLFRLGQDPLNEDWAAWQMSSSVNPFISPREIETAQAELPERAFQQEFLAQFLSLEGAGVFRGVTAVARLQPTEPKPGHQYVFGVDWGRSNDFTAISILDATTRAQVALDRFTQVDWEFQSERLHGWAEAYRPRAIVAETNAMGNPVVERLQLGYTRVLGKPRAALPMIPWLATNASKSACIQSLSLAIDQGRVSLLDDAVQTAELLAYEQTRLPSGLLRYGAPSGGHDDTVIALALAWQGASIEPAPARTSYAFSNGR